MKFGTPLSSIWFIIVLIIVKKVYTRVQRNVTYLTPKHSSYDNQDDVYRTNEMCKAVYFLTVKGERDN